MPSLQSCANACSLCMQMRERMQTENRQGFTDRQGRPLEFSSYQMKHFLKSAEHKCAAAASISYVAWQRVFEHVTVGCATILLKARRA